MAVNVHTLFGKGKEERDREFNAVLEWVVQRAKSSSRMYFKNFVLLGDLNLHFDDAEVKKSDVIKFLLELQSNLLAGADAARVNFPFLDVHPGETTLFSTDARRDQTFDHIAFFIDKDEVGLPRVAANATAGDGPNHCDYGVFDFVELFAQALHGSAFDDLSKAQQADLLKKSNADVSDHLHIWDRLPIPGA